MTRRTYVLSLIASIVVALLLRVRFMFTPLSADEGGFVAIARAWGHGRDLYRQVWVDRPQGLLVVFRVWDGVFGSSTVAVRAMAMTFAVLAIVSGATVATCLSGRRAGVLAALFIAVLSSSPVLEGFIANGELLSGALSLAGLAAGCLTIVGRRPARWMFLSGVLAGGAMSIKQSGIDGFVALLAWLVLALVFAWRDRRLIARWLLLLVGGFVLVLGALALHGALTGWHDWWFAFAGYRLSSRSAFVGAEWPRFWDTAHVALPVLAPMVVLSLTIGSLSLLRRVGRRKEFYILPIWLFMATITFASGGQFHRHYWIILTFPVAVFGAVRLASVPARWLRIGLALIGVAPALIGAMRIISLPRDDVPFRSGTERRAMSGEHIATWFREHRMPAETMYMMCSNPAFYGMALEDPPFPYLWADGLRLVPGAREALGAFLTSTATRPTFIAIYQPPDRCDPSGVSGLAIEKFYRPLTVIDDVQILVRTDR